MSALAVLDLLTVLAVGVFVLLLVMLGALAFTTPPNVDPRSDFYKPPPQRPNDHD